jgi:putative transposase
MGRKSESFNIRLTAKEKAKLAGITRKGNVNARVLNRAHILRQLTRGDSPPMVAENLGIAANTVRNVARRFQEFGLEDALFERPRPGQAPLLNTRQKQQIIAMVCADPPPGRARWTLHLIVDEACRMKIVSSISHETVRRLLQEHDLKPWREKNVVHRGNHPGISRTNGRCIGDI